MSPVSYTHLDVYKRQELNKEVLKISLCFDMQVIENVPVSDYDMKIDMIITEKGILIN